MARVWAVTFCFTFLDTFCYFAIHSTGFGRSKLEHSMLFYMHVIDIVCMTDLHEL